MALTSPAITLSVEAIFGHVKPVVDALQKLGVTDFSTEKPSIDLKPGETIKYPLAKVAAAAVFNASTNNYLTGGNTDWGTLTASHYLQGFDVSGENIDQGVNAARMKQIFARRAGAGIAAAVQNAVKTALDGTTASTGVKIATAPTLEQYMALAADRDWLNRANATLAVNGAEYAKIKGAFAANHIVGSDTELARFLGFKDIVLVPGMTARIVIVPESTFAALGRVPAIVAKYQEAGTETDPDTGLSVGIVVADDQAKNRVVVNADLWFGCVALSAPAAAGEGGIVKVGTAS